MIPPHSFRPPESPNGLQTSWNRRCARRNPLSWLWGPGEPCVPRWSGSRRSIVPTTRSCRWSETSRPKARHYPMPLPFLMSSEHERDQMLRIDPIARVRAVAAKADLRLVGIGQMDQRAQVFVDGFVSREALLEMMRLGAVGELTGWAFDEQGHIIDGGTNLRITSIPPRVPAQALTIGAAVGRGKVAAIRAALKGRLLNGLITDEPTAGAILKP